jgi:serine/threonine-protein kinase RsbW
LPEVDTTVPLEQRPIGGLGIHLMRRFMDEIEYRSDGGKNVLRMRKRLPQ